MGALSLNYLVVDGTLNTTKAGVPLPDFTEFGGIGVDGRNLMRFMFAQIPSDFTFPLLTNRIPFL